MHIDVWVILLATSLIVLLPILVYLFADKANKTKVKQALARELSLYREERLRDIEHEETLAQEKLTSTLEQIEQNKQSINELVENYRQQKLFEVTVELEKKHVIFTQEFEKKREQYIIQQEQLKNQADEIAAELDTLRAAQDAATQAWLRKALETNEYNLQLTSNDLLEIEDLKTLALKYPRIRPILLKGLYEIYYAPEIKQLLSRVVGGQKVSGIYRITSKLDGRIYIGKSVDIRNRWITHFKRAAGIESETTNLLYPAMRQQGLQNFSFEVIEIVPDENQLSSREKYWQEFYQAKTHGFSVK